MKLKKKKQLYDSALKVWRYEDLTKWQKQKAWVLLTSRQFFWCHRYILGQPKSSCGFFFFRDIIHKNINELFGQPNTYSVSIWPGKFRKVTYGLGQPAIWANQEQALFWDADFNCIMLEFLQFDPGTKAVALVSPSHSFQLAGRQFLN